MAIHLCARRGSNSSVGRASVSDGWQPQQTGHRVSACVVSIAKEQIGLCLPRATRTGAGLPGAPGVQLAGGLLSAAA